MPGRDKVGLDGSAWKNLDPLTAIAQRRETTTGVEARSKDNRTYLEATKTKTIPTDFGELTALQQAGEKSRTHLTRVASFMPQSREEKMM